MRQFCGRGKGCGGGRLREGRVGDRLSGGFLVRRNVGRRIGLALLINQDPNLYILLPFLPTPFQVSKNR